MNLKYLFSVAAIVLLLAATSSGEIYQYTDEGGVVRFTDDVSLIPEDQRPDVKTFESVQSNYSLEETVQESSTLSEDTWTGQVRITAKDLDAMRDDLLREFNALEAEKKALGDPPPKNAKSGVKAEYTYKVTDLNRRIDKYQQRNREFQKKVDEFNSQIGR
ncbi:MAG: DUF4124 domain-containing protein [Desulfobacteraceae bacterium]|nr:DUF4124 domain-containing protein [Desulfobacteraceae bacterium]MBC2754527.1 DUF4124 domain-containing protein [Desulfobacteraceae bacterium]MBC2763808.1 DUF4124 domain-containing protein [ANME-2 cluster archaeon]